MFLQRPTLAAADSEYWHCLECSAATFSTLGAAMNENSADRSEGVDGKLHANESENRTAIVHGVDAS